ncbi:MAG: hypothetical protein DME04_06730 [Candidatus Rokuibacteriota bacterium]|nr:MAG: hypothetical protein DME04_06730 [Candidatus Rokubacteria bacterium]
MHRALRRPLVAVLVGLVVLVAVGLSILPEVVRRIAVREATKLTGRAVSLADVDLNLFTGYVALKGFKLAHRGSPESAIELERLEVRLDYVPLLFHEARITELTLTSLRINAQRVGETEFDFSDLLALVTGDPSAPPSQWKITLARVSLRPGTIVFRDLVTAPPSEWRVEGLTVDASDLSTRSRAKPGRLALKLRLNGASVSVTSDLLTLDPFKAAARVDVDGFDLGAVRPYLPPSVAAAPRAGRASLALELVVELGPAGLTRAVAAGDLGAFGLEVVQAGRTEPFLKLPRLGVKVKAADLVARTVTVASVELEGLAVKAVKDAQQRIDLLALAAAREEGLAAAPAASAATAAQGGFSMKVEQIGIRKGAFTFRDEGVSPVTTLAGGDLTVDVTNVTWPTAGPAAYAASLRLPTAGRLDVRGSVTPQPFDLEMAISLRGGTIEPFQAYIPVPARLSGIFNAESRNRMKIADDGTITATSTGKSTIEKFAIRAPGETKPTVSVESIQLDGIDFAWPKHARAAKITITKPDMLIERDADGAISVRKLFETGAETTDAAKGAPTAGEAPSRGLPLLLEFGTVAITEGNARFLDRTTTPAFSETLSRLEVTVEGLSSTPGRRAKIATQAVVGGASAFVLQGEIAPLGDLYADMSGELRDFELTSVNPYADAAIAWFMKTGRLAAKVQLKIEKTQLTAENEIDVRNLTVAPSREGDEVKKRIGLPLGMIVALITDSDNSIKVNVPLSGELSQLRAGLGDAIWVAVRNALVNVISAPFKGIGRLFKGKGDTVDDLKVDPVTFAAGSAEVAPEMDQHLTQVADFLRRAPMIKLALTSVAAPRDGESLRVQELTLKIQRVQLERRANFNAAVAAVFKERLPGVAPPKSADEQLAVLHQREPFPQVRVTELLTRRLAAVRDALTTREGIPAARLLPGDARPSSEPPTAGQVEFEITH